MCPSAELGAHPDPVVGARVERGVRLRRARAPVDAGDGTGGKGENFIGWPCAHSARSSEA
jgi:hypothetical protein